MLHLPLFRRPPILHCLTMDKSTRIVAALFLAAFASACSDEPPTTAPEAAVRPELGIVTATDLFFYGPPVGESQKRAAQFDPTQLSVLTFEVCLESELSDPLVNACANPLARWTSDGGPSGISGEIFLVRNDWYQLDIPFAELGGELVIDGETTYVGRVIVGDPDVESVHAYGAFTFVLVESLAGGPNAPGEAMKVKFDRDLPVKWFLGVGASQELLCEPGTLCTTKVIVAEDGGELCFPDGDCGSPDATAGVSIEGGVLPHDIVLQIEDRDADDDPLGIQNNTIEEAVDISATPPFDDLDAFDNDGDGVADIAVKLCYLTADPDPYATYRSTASGAERLPFDPRLDLIFENANCEGTNGVVTFLGDGVLGNVERAIRTRVLRPAWRFLGPQPLRAGDKSFTADTRGFSVFAPALPLNLVANESPATAPPASTVPLSVCVESDPHDGSDPVPEAGVDVTFETNDGSLSSPKATSQLEPADNVNCDASPNQNGQVAVARVDWTTPDVQDGTVLSARAFLPGDYLVSDDDDLDGDQDNTNNDGVFELEDEIIEVEFETIVSGLLVACGPYPAPGGGDQFALRGFYMTDYPGTTLDRVELFLWGDVSGSYEVSLTAVDGSFTGTDFGTATTTVDLDGSSDQNVPTSFDFGAITTTFGQTVAFIPEVVSAPSESTTFFNVPGEDESDFGLPGDAGCSEVIETNGTTSAIGQDDRRQGVGIRVFGTTLPPGS